LSSFEGSEFRRPVLQSQAQTMYIGIACQQLYLQNLPAAVIDLTLQLAGAQR
jgi:hypothetical protein